MEPTQGVCYHGSPVRKEGNLSDSTTTIRWTEASMLVGGVLFALYGILNILAPNLVGFFLLGNLFCGAFLTMGVNGLRAYLRERGVPLGRSGRVGLWACIVALAIWTALNLATIVGLALLGPTRLLERAVDVGDVLGLPRMSGRFSVTPPLPPSV